MYYKSFLDVFIVLQVIKFCVTEKVKYFKTVLFHSIFNTYLINYILCISNIFQAFLLQHRHIKYILHRMLKAATRSE
jgi:hypothetical protein